MRLQFKVVGHCIAEYIRCLYAFAIITFARHFTCFTAMTISSDLWRLFVCFVALRPKSTAMVIAGRSVHLSTLFPGQA